MSLLVDPLAALFRHELSKIEPLVLDATEVEVELLPPLARVAITRRFSNTSCSLLEAVLTLPPTAQHEVVYGLTVTINGAAYHARARHHADASSAHTAAITEGRRAILHELIADVVQLVSIAGIEAGAQVAVRIESIRPLNRPDDDSATLRISLTAEPRRVNCRLSDADALLIVPNTHDAMLTVVAEGLKVMLNDPQRLISPGESCPIDCRETIALHITALGDRSLDYSCRHVESPGGWEASSRPSAEGFSRPMRPSGSVTSNRTDWMFGRMDTADREIRITAPMPDRDGDALSPNARATAAFAAAALAGAARRHDPDSLRLAANVLSPFTNLVFVGQNGELPDELPTLRKLALPRGRASDVGPALQPAMPIVAPPPPVAPMAEAADENLPSAPDQPVTPGARPPSYVWLDWAAAAAFLLWVLGALQFLSIPLAPVLGVFIVLLLLDAVRYFPRAGAPVRRRLPLLALLALPWIISILFGPLALVEPSADPAQRDWMVEFQGWLLGASGILPLLLLPVMRGGRGFTIVAGILNFVAAFFAASVANILNLPGS